MGSNNTRLSPRQKMINLMYIVLTAMLALNVSSDVLNGFTQVEEGLKRTNTNVEERNSAILNTLEAFATQNPDKGKRWYDKATEVRRVTDGIYRHIDSLKYLIVREADGSDADVADKPLFADIAAQLAESFAGCDIAGFNSNRFDVPMLAEEFARVGVDFDFTAPRYVDVQTIFHKKEQRTLSAAYRFYCDKDLEGAHSANADTRATYEVLLAQLERYADLPCDIDGLSDFSMQQKNVDLAGRLVYDDQHREVINFGKYKGQLAADVLQKDPGYYNWIQQGDFPSETKRRFTAIRMRHHR